MLICRTLVETLKPRIFFWQEEIHCDEPGSTYPRARQPGTSKTASWTSGFCQVYLKISYNLQRKLHSFGSQASENFLIPELRHIVTNCLQAITWTNVGRSWFMTPYSIIQSQWVNSLAPGRFYWNLMYVVFKLILVLDDWGISCEICLQMNVIGPYWW